MSFAPPTDFQPRPSVCGAPLVKMADDEKRMELTEHLAELRTRILRMMLYLAIGATASFVFFPKLYLILRAPLDEGARRAHVDVQVAITHFTTGFFTVLQMAVVAGLILTSPLVVAEIWGFVAPALTREEKRPLRWVVPFSIVLFAGGVTLAYLIAPFAIQWFLGYVNSFGPAELLQDPRQFVLFLLKLMAAFGLVFQLPVILMFLAWIGILSSATMKRSWRHAVVGISVIGLFVTPSNDPFTMLMMIIPVIVLYIGSISLVGMVERARARRAT